MQNIKGNEIPNTFGTEGGKQKPALPINATKRVSVLPPSVFLVPNSIPRRVKLFLIKMTLIHPLSMDALFDRINHWWRSADIHIVRIFT
jgi:hypothetical protein